MFSFPQAFSRHISSFAATFPRSLHHPSSSTPSTSRYHSPSSIPQLPPFWTTTTINLVRPQEVGHRGTLKRVTHQPGPNLYHHCRRLCGAQATLSTNTQRQVLWMPGFETEQAKYRPVLLQLMFLPLINPSCWWGNNRGFVRQTRQHSATFPFPEFHQHTHQKWCVPATPRS